MIDSAINTLLLCRCFKVSQDTARFLAMQRWTDLRHQYASLLVLLGVPLNTVPDLLGHSSVAMSLRDAQLVCNR
jgi:hypothetical protein